MMDGRANILKTFQKLQKKNSKNYFDKMSWNKKSEIKYLFEILMRFGFKNL